MARGTYNIHYSLQFLVKLLQTCTPSTPVLPAIFVSGNDQLKNFSAHSYETDTLVEKTYLDNLTSDNNYRISANSFRGNYSFLNL